MLNYIFADSYMSMDFLKIDVSVTIMMHVVSVSGLVIGTSSQGWIGQFQL